MDIRALGPNEASVLRNAAPDLFDDPVVPKRAEEFLADPRHHLVVAIDEGTVVGMISAVHYVHPDKPAPELWINEVSVAETHHKRGLAKAMMREVLGLARGLGCGEAWVLTDRHNEAAMRLYAASGGAEYESQTVMFNFALDAEPAAGGRANEGTPEASDGGEDGAGR